MTQPLPAEPRAQSSTVAQSALAARRHVASLLLLAFLGAALAGGLTRLQPNTYVSTVSLVVQTTSGASDTETLIRTMQALVSSEIIGADLARATGARLTPDEVVDRISVRRPPGAGVFTVAVADTDPERSRQLARQLVPAFEDRVDELSQPEPGELAVNYSVRPWASGLVNTTVDQPPIARNSVLGLGLGALLGLLVLALHARRHPVVLSPQHASEAYELPLLGAVPRLSARGANAADVLDVVLPSGGSISWPFPPRRLLVLVSDAVPDPAAVLLALGESLQSRGPVALLDAHDRPGSLTDKFRMRRSPGLGEVLAGEVSARASLVEAGNRPRVRVLGMGEHTREVMGSGGNVADLVRDLARDQFVILASSAGGLHPWVRILDAVDAVLVVATLKRTTVEEARVARDTLLAAPALPAAVLVLEHDRILSASSGSARVTPVDMPAQATQEDVDAPAAEAAAAAEETPARPAVSTPATAPAASPPTAPPTAPPPAPPAASPAAPSETMLEPSYRQG